MGAAYRSLRSYAGAEERKSEVRYVGWLNQPFRRVRTPLCRRDSLLTLA